METLELSPALLQPQSTVVATLGELLATLPSWDEEMLLPVSAVNLYWDLVKFTWELRATLYSIDDTWWCHIVTSHDDDPVTSLSQALAAYKSTPWTPQNRVTRRASKWQQSVAAFVDSWVELARKATKLFKACREVDNEVANMVAAFTAQARELQAMATHYGTAQENMGELGQTLGGEEGDEVVAGHEAWVRRQARVAASRETRATKVRQRVEVALGLLERLVAACEEATAFPRELQRLLGDIEAALKGTTEASVNVPEDLVAKVAVAKQLWEANARQATHHLVETVPDIIKFYFTGDPASPSACEVTERCQRAIEDIPRLLRPPEPPQSIPKVSPLRMEPQELSPALLQPQVSIVAALGELLATLPRLDEMILLEPAVGLYRDLEDFTRDLRITLYCIDDTWWRRKVPSDDDDCPSSLSRALAAYKSTPWITWNHVKMVASKWQGSVAALVRRGALLARKATKLHTACRKMATEAADMVATTTAQEPLQDKAACYGTSQENTVELGQAQGGEEGAEEVAGREAWVRREARVAASQKTRATMVRQRLEAALGLLERLVAACNEATAFPRELQWRLRDTETALKGTNEASPTVPEDLVAKVAMAERLWEANARLVKDHLLGTLQDIINFSFTGGPHNPSACEVAEWCQRAIEDIPRLIRPPERCRGVPKVSPVSMELQELSLALMQPQVTVVATLAELLATLPRRDEMMLPVSTGCLYWDLADFTKDLRVTLYCVDDTWWCHNVTFNDDDRVTSLSRALAAYKSTPWTSWDNVTMAAIMWHGLVAVLVDRWTQLARAATKLPNTCREVATEAADMVATATAWARELQDEVAHYGTGQKNMVELGQALGREEGAEALNMHEAWVWEEARVAASQATRASMVRQRVEVALGLLEPLVAACDEATAFPRELQRRVGDIVATLKGKNEVSPNVPEDLVAQVAVAEQLWEANACLAKEHLLGAVPDIIKFLFNGAPISLSACEVTEQCQRAIEDIPRLLRPLECPQGIHNVSPVSMELQELSPVLLQPQVTIVAILGELLATLPRVDEEMLLFMSPGCLYWDLEEFTNELWATMKCIEGIWWHCNVPMDVPEPLTSLSRALAAYKGTPWTTWFHVTMAASKWQGSVATLVDRWAQLARKAIKLPNTCREVATEAATEAATTTAWARKLQDKAARYGTAQENMVEMGPALGGEEGADMVAGHEAQVRRDARVAASWATRASRRTQRLEVALGLLERLVAACDEAAMFPRELQRRVGDIVATLKGKNEASPNFPEDLVAKVAMAEQLWEANARLAKDHLWGALQDIIKFYFDGCPDSPSACGVAERCQRAIEDIPSLLHPLECPQGVPKVSPGSMELQELSPVLLQPQVTVVAILGELLATLPRMDEEMLLFMSPGCPFWVLEEFTNELWATMKSIDGTWWCHNVTSNDDDRPTSLSQALAAYKSTPWTPRKCVTMVASKWHRSVDALVNSWAKLARKATKLHNTCRVAATKAADRVAAATAKARKLQDKAACDGTAQENMVELGQALGGEEGTKVVDMHEARVERNAMVAASKATRATTLRQRLEAALGLLEHLVAACDEATAFPWQLQCLLRDIKASLKGTNEASFNVPEAFVAKVVMAERLWEANARLAKDHLLGTLQDIIDCYFDGGPVSPCGVAERCQRAIEDIPRLVRPRESPQSIPKMSPLTPALLQPQVTVVATLGELLGTLPTLDKMMLQLGSALRLYWDLVDFTQNLRVTLYCTDDTWWRCNVTDDDDDDPLTYNDDGPLTSLSQALAAYKSTPWTTWFHVTMVASKWQGSVSVLVDRWAELARTATKLCKTCREVAIVVANRMATATARARELQDKAAHYGTPQENMVELGQALGREEGAKVVPGHEAWVRREARVAASKATMATTERQRLDAALGLLERLVAACDEATAFPRELQRRVGDIVTILKGTKKQFPDVPEDLVAKVAMAERLWEANARLAKGHLLGAVPDTIKFLFSDGPNKPSACEVTEQCQRAIKDIPSLLRPPECPQGVPRVSPGSTELQELSPLQLQVLVAVVATLGEVVATVTGPHREKFLHESSDSLHEDLKNFTQSLRVILDHGDVISLGHRGVTSLGWALASLRATPGSAWANVRDTAKAWWELVARLVDRWDWLARVATEVHYACRKVVMDQQLMVALDKKEVAWEMAMHNAQVSAATSESMGEAVVATRRGHWAEETLGLLQRLVATCDRATLFNWNMEWWLRDIEAILKGTNEVSSDVLQALVAKVAKFEGLWDASARLAKEHLLGTLGVIDNILLSPCGDHGGPNGPGSRAVAKQCQKAIEDIPRLLLGQ